jgi:hypothetical protein
MVLPPNRIGASRGPNGSTLDDVVAAINGLSVVVGEQTIILESMRNFLDSVANDVQTLTGTPSVDLGWQGLPHFLRTYVYEPFDEFDTSRTLAFNTYFSREGIQRLVRYLGGNTASSDAVTRTGGLIEMLGGTNTSNNAREVSFLLAIASVLGELEADPVGSSIKDLLRSIDVNALRSADCCEEGGNSEPDPDNPNNDPPVNFGCANAIRVSEWVNRGTVDVSGVTNTLWQARFNTVPTGITQFVASGDQATSYGLAISPTKYDLCISWNFNNNLDQPNAFGRNRSNLQNTAATDTFVAGPVSSGSSFIIGGLVDELSRCEVSDPDDDWCGYMFRVPGTATPGLNAFLASV